ncbi:MAG: hypothetical protein ACYC1A_02270, partial [Spirochaetales bacterium]
QGFHRRFLPTIFMSNSDDFSVHSSLIFWGISRLRYIQEQALRVKPMLEEAFGQNIKPIVEASDDQQLLVFA